MFVVLSQRTNMPWVAAISSLSYARQVIYQGA